MQQNVAVLHRELRTGRGVVVVDQRRDGYVNLTQMGQASGKLVGTWRQNQDTQDYLDELSSTIGIPIVDLLFTVNDAPVGQRHTWGHPRVALKFAAWCNKKFEVQVYEWIEELRTTGVVDLRPKGTAVQNALNAIGLAVKDIDEHVAVVEAKTDANTTEIARVNSNVVRIEQAYYTVQKKRQTAAQRHNRMHRDDVMREKAYRFAGGRCMNPHCRRSLWLHPDEAPSPDDVANVDHVNPVNYGGRLTWDDLQVLCPPCHRRKTLAELQAGRAVASMDFRHHHPGFVAQCAEQQEKDTLQQIAAEQRRILPLFDGCCLPLRPEPQAGG